MTESDLSGNTQREYVAFAGKRIARLDLTINCATVGASCVHYYFSDHLGSSNVVADYRGTMQACGSSPVGYTTVATGEEESDFLPYGREMPLCDTAPQHYKFTGKERDTESGLDNFGARYDSSNLGRFMTPDWALTPVTVPYAKFGDPQSLNLYAYVENSPVNAADADGHDPPQCSNTTNTEHTNSQTCAQSRAGELDEAAAGPYKFGAELRRAQARLEDLFAKMVEEDKEAQNQGGSSTAEKREQIGETAASFDDSTRWSYFAPPCPEWKCSKFVHDVLRMVGIGGKGQPLAAQLADPKFHMKGWTDATNGDFAALHVGDIVAYAYPRGTSSVATGDSGIITAIHGDSVMITAAGQRRVYTEHLSEWRRGNPAPGQPFMVRTYVGP